MAPLNITIPTTSLSNDATSKPYITYQIRISHPFRAQILTKRYSDFATLNTALQSQTGSAPPSPLPAKSWLGGSLSKLGFGSTAGSPEQVEERRKGLERYLQAIEGSEDGRWRAAPSYRSFLELGEKESKRNGVTSPTEGHRFGKDRIADASDWLDKYSDLKGQLQEARLWLTRREQASAATAQHEAGANAKRGLVRASTLIEALEDGLRRLSGKGNEEWGGDRLGEGEIRRRRDLVGAARKEREGLEGVLNTMAVKTAVNSTGAGSTAQGSSAQASTQQKEGLFKGATQSSGRRVLGAPAKETEKTRELDNEGVLQLQKQIMQEQDEDVMDLGKIVSRMREMGVQINEEIVLQNQMLGLLEEDVDRHDAKTRIAKQRIGKIK